MNFIKHLSQRIKSHQAQAGKQCENEMIVRVCTLKKTSWRTLCEKLRVDRLRSRRLYSINSTKLKTFKRSFNCYFNKILLYLYMLNIYENYINTYTIYQDEIHNNVYDFDNQLNILFDISMLLIFAHCLNQ